MLGKLLKEWDDIDKIEGSWGSDIAHMQRKRIFMKIVVAYIKYKWSKENGEQV